MDTERVHRLEAEVAELRDIVTSLTISVLYSEDEPLEAFYSKYSVTGLTRSALLIATGAIYNRAEGHEPSTTRAQEALDMYPVVSAAQQPGPMDLAEATKIIGEILGSQSRALEYLIAHYRRGLTGDSDPLNLSTLIR